MGPDERVCYFQRCPAASTSDELAIADRSMTIRNAWLRNLVFIGWSLRDGSHMGSMNPVRGTVRGPVPASHGPSVLLEYRWWWELPRVNEPDCGR